MSTHTCLSKLTQPEAYRTSGREHIYPSPGSLEWIIRRHRARFVKAGALVKIGGRFLLHEHRFDAEVLALGQEAMTAEAA